MHSRLAVNIPLQLFIKILSRAGQDDHHQFTILFIDAVSDLIIGLVVVDIVAIESGQVTSLAFSCIGILGDMMQRPSKRPLSGPFLLVF